MKDRETCSLPEKYMLSCMDDSAHDKEHVYDHFYTKKAASPAKERRHTAVDYYNSPYHEAASAYLEDRFSTPKITKSDFFHMTE